MDTPSRPYGQSASCVSQSSKPGQMGHFPRTKESLEKLIVRGREVRDALREIANRTVGATFPGELPRAEPPSTSRPIEIDAHVTAVGILIERAQTMMTDIESAIAPLNELL